MRFLAVALVLLTLSSCQGAGVRVLHVSRSAPKAVPIEPAALPLTPPTPVSIEPEPTPTPTPVATPTPEPSPTPTPTTYSGGGGGGGGGGDPPPPPPPPPPANEGAIGVTVRLTEPTLAPP
jgi:hypothetical protein